MAYIYTQNGTSDIGSGAGSGKMGIGTSSPSDKLHVKDGNVRIESASYPQLVLRDSNAGSNNKQWKIYLSEESGSVTELRGIITNDADSSGTLWLRVKRSGTTVKSVNFENGKVGIGTADPSSTLHVKGSVVLQDLPTYNPGAVGALWNDNGNLRISQG